MGKNYFVKFFFTLRSFFFRKKTLIDQHNWCRIPVAVKLFKSMSLSKKWKKSKIGLGGKLLRIQCLTVWKFHNFSITQILREFKFLDSTSAKSAISAHFEVLNFDFYELWHFSKRLKITRLLKTIQKIEPFRITYISSYVYITENVEHFLILAKYIKIGNLS